MLQRELARHPAIATISEPWFLLGLFDPATVDFGGASFGYSAYRSAMEDLMSALPNGKADWYRAVRLAASEVYERLMEAQEKTAAPHYFLDKTPRYSLAPDALRQVFPDAPIIVLWRNPLAIVASMMSTYSEGKWNMHHFTRDMFVALPRLIDFVRLEREKLLVLRYEEVVADVSTAREQVFSYLNLQSANIESLSSVTDVKLGGRMGDPTGGMNSKVGKFSGDRWKEHFCNPLRRRWARSYLRWLGAERLAVMGYDFNELEAHLDSCGGMFERLASDVIRMPRGFLSNLLLLPLVRTQFKQALGRRPLLRLQ